MRLNKGFWIALIVAAGFALIYVAALH